MQQLVEIIKSVRQSRVEVNAPLSKNTYLIQAKDKEIERTLSQKNKDYLIIKSVRQSRVK